MPVFNFKLKHPDKISPWGSYPNERMHWFGLTDGEYWIELEKVKIYEYTKEVLKHWKVNEYPKYADYHIVRFLEDFTDLFKYISETLPVDLYNIAQTHASLYEYERFVNTWLDNIPEDTPEEIFDDYIDRREILLKWIADRTMDSGHLVGGPWLSFFRFKNKIVIVWNTDYLLEESIPIWTAKNGEYEMEYDKFVSEVEDFGERFFKAMDDQVAFAVKKDWRSVEIDKNRLLEEHQERKAEFALNMKFLKENGNQTDWNQIITLMKEIK